ncbi:hypothetical protein TcWFU_007467 [Taenia crassiceps]|uniref:Uncharacterized protein n=1 Tax=Taenia crassiceps TaxID=6207 RepID=A0ABR4QSY2_9CEST
MIYFLLCGKEYQRTPSKKKVTIQISVLQRECTKQNLLQLIQAGPEFTLSSRLFYCTKSLRYWGRAHRVLLLTNKNLPYNQQIIRRANSLPLPTPRSRPKGHIFVLYFEADEADSPPSLHF